jgi:hypothetical protein
MRRRRPVILISVVALAGLALLVAGCGGKSSPRVANVASSTASTATTAQSGLVGFAGCMRSHGVPTFPDPDGTGVIPKDQVVAARQQNPSRFDSAANACRRLAPTGGLAPPETPQQQHARLVDGLSFARCMRSHGVTRFPDPTPQGQLTVEMVQAQGIDVHSPSVLRVVQTCLPASHGALTPAKVREAIDNAGSTAPTANPVHPSPGQG